MLAEDFTPPFVKEDLARLDALHAQIGIYPEWLKSDARAEIARTEPTTLVVPDGPVMLQDTLETAKSMLSLMSNAPELRRDEHMARLDRLIRACEKANG